MLAVLNIAFFQRIFDTTHLKSHFLHTPQPIFTQLCDATPLFASWVEGVVGHCDSAIAATRRNTWRSVVEAHVFCGFRVHVSNGVPALFVTFPPGADVAEL